MPKQIDPIKKLKYKNSRLNNNSKTKALLDAGYSLNTAKVKNTNRNNMLVKVSEEELQQEISKKNVSVDYFLKERKRIQKKCEEKGDYTNVIRSLEGMERISGVEQPQSIINLWNIDKIDSKEPDVLTKLARKKV